MAAGEDIRFSGQADFPSLPLRRALTFFGADLLLTGVRGHRAMAEYHRLDTLEAPTADERRELTGLRWTFLRRIIDRLRNGELALHGFLLGTFIELPEEWLAGLEPGAFDAEAETLTVGNQVISGVALSSMLRIPPEAKWAAPAPAGPPVAEVQPAPVAQRPKKRKRRRKSTAKQELPEWKLIKEDALKWLRENGVPVKGDEQQAAFEREIARLLSVRGITRAESTVRVRAKTYMAAHLRPIQIEPGKACK